MFQTRPAPHGLPGSPRHFLLNLAKWKYFTQ